MGLTIPRINHGNVSSHESVFWVSKLYRKYGGCKRDGLAAVAHGRRLPPFQQTRSAVGYTENLKVEYNDFRGVDTLRVPRGEAAGILYPLA